MRVTSHCQNCGNRKAAGDMYELYCYDCFSSAEGAKAAAVAEGKDPSDARRDALARRAHIAHRNFTDPRGIDRKTIWMYGNAPKNIQGDNNA
jgi:hypothetical protein